MIPRFANPLLYLPLMWLRTAFCFSFVCLFIVIFTVATGIIHLIVAILHVLELKSLEAKLKLVLTSQGPGHAFS